MADQKISQLTLKSPAAVTDALPIFDNASGQTKKTTIQDIVNLTTSSGSATSINVNQASHGLSVGYVIRLSGTNTYVLAKADSAANAEAVGIVTAVSDVDNFTYVTEGAITVGVPAVAAGTVLFLSDTSAGTLTATAPTTAGHINMPLATVTENAVKMVFHKYRGMELGNSSVGATSVATYTASGTTLSLTTGANDKVIVWAKGNTATGQTSAAHNYYLNYNGVQKDVVTSDGETSDVSPFSLNYTETPGAATHDITVTSDAGTPTNVVIIAQVITPVQASGAYASTSIVGQTKLSVAPASSTSPIAVGDNDPRANGYFSSSATNSTGLSGGTTEVTQISVAIPTTAVFGTSSVVKVRIFFSRNFTYGSANNSYVKWKMNGTTLITQTLTTSNVKGMADFYFVNNSSVSSQNVQLIEYHSGTTITNSATTSAIDTSAGVNTFSLTAQAGTSGDTYVVNGYSLEKIK